MTAPVIYWYRHDLRVDDLPGLRAAIRTGQPVLPVFVLDEAAAGDWQPGGASRWWLHHALVALGETLAARGATLVLRRGNARDELSALVEATGADAVFCSRQYEPWARAQENAVHDALLDAATVKRFGGHLLFEPEQIANQQGQPYRVFTPFWRECRKHLHDVAPSGRLPKGQWFEGDVSGDALDDWALLPTDPDWAAGWTDLWTPGEAAAHKKLKVFLKQTVDDYETGRDFPARAGTSRLSAHLHFGEISPARVVAMTREATASAPAREEAGAKFLSEVGWREFSHHLLHHFPGIPETSFNARFEAFPWVGNRRQLRAWQRGRTGYPLVDAGMRELWQTGYMHNRVRMVVASFLCKHLLIDWRAGERWFWDTLLDADLANNACSWQWVAGSGADASPYFRIFNPITQSRKFDKGGQYIRQWVPELAGLPDKHLHAPWEAPEAVLDEAGITLGEDYPAPMVDHSAARESALAAYASLPEAN